MMKQVFEYIIAKLKEKPQEVYEMIAKETDLIRKQIEGNRFISMDTFRSEYGAPLKSLASNELESVVYFFNQMDTF